MQKSLLILAAAALLGQFKHTAAQTAATKGQMPDQFFSTVIRSSAVPSSLPPFVAASPIKEKDGRGPIREKDKGTPIGAPLDQATLKRCCEKIKKDVQRVYFLQAHNGKMKLQVKGVYTHGTAIFFWLQLNNRSPLDYEVDSIRFLVTAGGKNKGPSAPTPKTLQPVFVYDSTTMVPGRSRAVSIFVLPRFTLSDGQQLLIHVQERNGGRQLRVQATHWTLERARLI